jgi:hypothetical protein
MLPRAEAPARRLPYTTADMAERLAKKKAEQANQALRYGVTNPPVIKKDEPWYRDALGAVGGAIKSVYDNMPMSNPISTPVNMGGNAGVSMGGQGTGKSLVTEPARLAVRRAVGDITAIPKVGEDSPSYTADQIREQGVARGLLGAAIDYSQFIPVVAKGAGVTGDVLNAYKLARMERAANPFPALRYADDVIDVIEGSRLPARVADAPIATPSERFGQALADRMNTAELSRSGARDAGTIRLPGGEPTPPANNVRDLNAYRLKTNQVDPRALKKNMYGFLQDENFNPITNGLDQQQYNAVFLSYNPPGLKDVLDSLNFKPYNKQGMLTTNYKGLVPLYNDQFYLELNHNNFNGMGNYVDVYKRPELWDFVDNNQLEYLGQAYGPDITRNLQTIIKDATPTTTAPSSISNLAEAIAEPPASRLTPPAFRERPVPASSRLTVETVGGQNYDGTLNTNASRTIVIRSFNQTTDEYTGVITIKYNPGDKTATVQGLAATNPIVTPQLISAAATEIRKLVGDVQYPLIPSDSLSIHSRAFVERLQQAGLIDPSYEIPETNMINSFSKSQGPESFANAASAGGGFGQTVIDPLSYQPTYNDVLKALVESRRQAKLAGETGRLNTSSSQLQILKFRPQGLNDARAYRVNMQSFRMPEHPLLKQMSDNELDSFMGEIFDNPGSAAQKLIDMWEKIKPSEELGIWADSYANTLENLKKFPDILKDAYLINEGSRIRLMSELENILLRLPEDEIFS